MCADSNRGQRSTRWVPWRWHPGSMAHPPVQLGNSEARRPQPPPTPRGPQTPQRPGTPDGAPRMRVGPMWWVLFAVLMAWNVYSFFPRHSTEVALPYSEFLTQLASGNVASTRIVGASI